MGQTLLGPGIACVPGFYEPSENSRASAMQAGVSAGTQSQGPVERSHKRRPPGQEAFGLIMGNRIVRVSNEMAAEVSGVVTEAYERRRQQKRLIRRSQNRTVYRRQFPDERVAIAMEVGTQGLRNGPLGGQLERPRIDSLLPLPDFIVQVRPGGVAG